jgi:hypothetical protein
MNEQIKLLADQCYEHDQSWTGVGQRIFNKEKFAELIVKECARVVSQKTGPKSALNVLEHFGVEE